MISPLENSGMMLRTQDYSALRQNEENHSSNLHVRIQDQLDNKDDENAHSVRHKDDSDKSNTEHDARNEGKNKYFNNRQNKKKEDNKPGQEGVVIAKRKTGFDITI